ncbi:unnamed protein product, partial [Cyprideis torosa]
MKIDPMDLIKKAIDCFLLRFQAVAEEDWGRIDRSLLYLTFSQASLNAIFSGGGPFNVLSFAEAKEILSNRFSSPVVNKNLTKEQEMLLIRHNGGFPLFVINWPREQKPFYMKSMAENQVAAFDLLVPVIGEVCGGSLRETDIESLQQRLPSPELQW